MIKTLYACPTWKCNMKCGHCEISRRQCKEDFKAFFEALKKVEAEEVILFGGEPMLDKFAYGMSLSTGKVTTVSSNLIMLDDDCLRWTKENNISFIATSWNAERFNTPWTASKYEIWLKNLEWVTSVGIGVRVLITLTPALFSMKMSDVLDVFEDMEEMGCREFIFEPYIGDKECNEEGDEWLCKFDDVYKGDMKNCTIDNLSNWKCDCSETWTLEPSGRLRKGCPQFKKVNVLKECLNCKLNDICQPCVLQKTCSYPKKFAAKKGIIDV